MRKPKIVNLFILIVLSQFIVSSCSKENEEELKFVPELGATEVSSVTFSTVSISGSVIGNGNDEVLERGVCWDTSLEPTVLKNKVIDGQGEGNFNCTIDNLLPNSQYYIRAYAINSTGIAYDSVIGIKTLPDNVDNLTDAINIVCATPTTNLTGGQTYSFEVTVMYKLSSLQTGTIMIGFNNIDNYNSSRIISDAEKIVNQGNGQHTFIVTTAAKDWGSEGDFSAYVNLSENPLPETWTPLTNDRFILIPQK